MNKEEDCLQCQSPSFLAPQKMCWLAAVVLPAAEIPSSSGQKIQLITQRAAPVSWRGSTSEQHPSAPSPLPPSHFPEGETEAQAEVGGSVLGAREHGSEFLRPPAAAAGGILAPCSLSCRLTGSPRISPALPAPSLPSPRLAAHIFPDFSACFSSGVGVLPSASHSLGSRASRSRTEQLGEGKQKHEKKKNK